MKITLVRGFSDSTVTLGFLQSDDVEHNPIFTLENPLRATAKDSLIPGGAYICRPYSSKRFPDCWEVHNVPGRTKILIHAGNNEADTTGCILVGLAAGVINDQPSVLHSRLAMDMLRKLIGKSDFILEIK